MQIAIQMDPLETLAQETDTTLALIRAACARNYRVWTFQASALRRDEDSLRTLARTATVSNTRNVDQTGNPQTLDLVRDVDVVLIRQDPPVNALYRTSAHLLSLLHGQTLVVNNPDGVLASPEKILPLAFGDLMPPTLLSRNRQTLAAFRQRHGQIVLKPLNGHGGSGIFLINQNDINFDAALDTLLATGPYPVVAQAYLEAVKDGDKRIILIGGKPLGAINRRPPQGSIRANMAVGGTAEGARLTQTDMNICERIGPELQRRGLILVGIDVIGGKLTEINVTSPTGMVPLREHCGIDAAGAFWDHIADLTG